jgi:hypothetical protein
VPFWKRSSKPSEREHPRGQRTPVLRCSFCNKSQRDVRKLIAGPTVYICDECVDICRAIIAEDFSSPGNAAASPGSVRCLVCHNEQEATHMLAVKSWGMVCEACAQDVQTAIPKAPWAGGAAGHPTEPTG